jgi:hypothetical protein
MFADVVPALSTSPGITKNRITGQRRNLGNSSEMKRSIPTQMADERSNGVRVALSPELWP